MQHGASSSVSGSKQLRSSVKRSADSSLDSGYDTNADSTVGSSTAKRPRVGHDESTSDATTSTDEIVDLVCSIVTDVLPAHVLELVDKLGTDTDVIINELFDADSYPRRPQGPKHHLNTNDKGKGRATTAETDYLDPARMTQDLTPQYSPAGINILSTKFPFIPLPYIRSTWQRLKFFAPTFYFLKDEWNKTPDQRMFRVLKNKRYSSKNLPQDDALNQEVEWVNTREGLERRNRINAEKERAAIAAELASGAITECTCCGHDKVPFSQSFFCTEGHSVCKECAVLNAETQVGSLKHRLHCPSMDACDGHFAIVEAERFLSVKTLEALLKIKQEAELDEAQIEGLVKCPFCPFACVMDDDDSEKLLRCMREECGAVTCRTCQKINHLPKTCEEAKADDDVSELHKVEEAMSEALIRRCPKCTKPFIKLNGCNSIHCSCGAWSCFICQKIINPYSHFDCSPIHTYDTAGDKCPTFYNNEERLYREVEKAREQAMATVDKTKLNDKHLKKLDLEAPDLTKPHETGHTYGRVAGDPYYTPPPPRPTVAAPPTPNLWPQPASVGTSAGPSTSSNQPIF